MTKKIFIIACEASGDSHGALLIEALFKQNPNIELRGLGGPKMQAAGVHLLHDMTTFSALGFGDVIRQYFDYKRVFDKALRDVRQFKPDTLVLIDSPAFNLRFAKKIKKKIPTLYYISPQLWAWGMRRMKVIRKTISKMLVILPFEEKMYDEENIPCEFVGHPLLDHIKRPEETREILRKNFGIQNGGKAIGILPGSRKKEIERILPLMLTSAQIMQENDPSLRFFLTESSNLNESVYEGILKDYPSVNLIRTRAKMHDVLAIADFCLITSGTATTEAAIYRTPFFLLYKTSWSTYILARLLVKIPYLGLVNILVDRKIVPEFIQHLIKPKTIAHEAKVLFENPELYEKMKVDLGKVAEQLGGPGASSRAAKAILAFIDS